MCGVGCWRASGFAWCVRSQVVGIATRRGARDETAARPAHARSAQAMRLTADTKRKPCNYKVHRIRRFNDTSWARPRFAAQCDFRWKIWFWLFCWWP